MANIKYFVNCIFLHVIQLIIRIGCIFPVKDNRIVFTSQMGEQYSCNPRYISEYLETQYPKQFEIIWLLNEPEKYQFLIERGVRVVDNHSLKKVYCELTAKASIINVSSKYARIPERKKQIHINTWHGGGYYKLSGLKEEALDKFARYKMIIASKNTSYFLSSNQCFTENEIRKDFVYKGEVLNIGLPRNDIFFHCNYTEVHKKVCDYFGVESNCKILLYAPTFRYNDNISKYVLPNFETLKKIAEKRFGGKWIVLTRMHYYSEFAIQTEHTFNANYQPDLPEMQELLAACDMLISDYSSCIWDYSFTYRPCLLFTPDLDEYTAERGFGIDIYDWGFPVCKTEQELWDAMERFDEDSFRKAMERHHDNLGSFEHGDATEITGKLIYDFCFPEGNVTVSFH
ncbi:MAG: CDP-glycerol glycerophosphotransferase family protein [Bacteroidales bacterium]|nr:CDP-glycerol glycerophosphotransferase family protein [Bacteroidales bacterium]